MSNRKNLFVIVLFVISGCSSQKLDNYLENRDRQLESAFIIDHGIHTAIVVKAKPMLKKLGLNNSLFSSYQFIEIGRGDAGFYRTDDVNFSITLKALFLSTPAIMHIRAYNRPPQEHFPASHSIEIELASSSMRTLMKVIADSFEFDDGSAIDLGESLGPTSHFFKARGNYHLFYTCNNWTAEMLSRAGYPIEYRSAFFSGSVMRQVTTVQAQISSCTENAGLDCGPAVADQPH